MPCMQECIVRLAVWMPFAKAAQLMEEMLGVMVSPTLAARYIEAAGAAYIGLQNAAADWIEREAPPAPAGGEKMVFSADGAMVPLQHGEWAEVKTLALGEVQAASREAGEEEVHTGNVSYFSRLVEAEQFEHLSLVEIHRRGLEHSREVAAVTDGADWLQGLVDYHCPQAIRILDFPHAAQRVSQVGQALFGEGGSETGPWVEERLHLLKHQGPRAILAEFESLQQEHADLEVLRENLAYLAKREAQMDYPRFRAEGWPIGSGMVESGNKLVVEARLKGAGMHWRRENVNPLLGLRNIVCNDRWTEEWPLIARQLRRQAWERRNQKREKRRLTKRPMPSEIVETPPEVEPKKPVEKEPKQRLQRPNPAAPRKPADNHPWRPSPIGRALYEPSKSAKN